MTPRETGLYSRQMKGVIRRLSGALVLSVIVTLGTFRPARAGELPLVLEPPQTAGATLAVFISGDGGWASIDAAITAELLGAGYGVVGLEAQRYFRNARTPEELANDVAAISHEYLSAWKRDRLLLIGYSRGADVMPFVATRLEKNLLSRVEAVVLLAPGSYTSFKFHLPDLWSNVRRNDSIDTLPEAQKVEPRMLCFYGSEESDSLCPLLPQDASHTSIELEGGHHFDGDYAAIGQQVLKLLGTADSRRSGPLLNFTYATRQSLLAR